MKKNKLVTIAAQCESLLRKFSASQSLSETKKLHALILALGVFSSSNVCSKLATTYAQCHHASYASYLFDKLPQPSLFSWNAMMRMYVLIGRPLDALNLFVEMLQSGGTIPDKFTYPVVTKACGDLFLIDVGVGIHGQTFRVGFDTDIFVQNTLLAMDMNAGEKEVAQLVFDLMQERTVISWNTMINGYLRNNCAEEALRVYHRMMDVGVEPDCATVVSALLACGLLKNLELGREDQALVQEKGFWGNIVVRNALLDMYVKCDQMKEAWLLANRMGEKDVVTWTTLINGYILNGDARSALMLCQMMQCEGVKPNSISIASFLSACGSLVYFKNGKCLHAWAIRQKLESEVVVETALIDMYAKRNRGNLSYKVFMGTSKKRTAPWNALLSAFIQNRLAREAIELFKQMLVKDIQPDNATFNNLLPAYAILADVLQAMNMHCYLIKYGFLYRLEVASILVDIYSKCGNLGYAHQIFNVIPLKDKDIILWSAIIAAYGKHGYGNMAVKLFNQMVQSGVKPNQVTFTSVLHACSHAGLVDEGLFLFKFMLEQHQSIPCVDHYTCIIDLLGRAGRLNDAYNLIRTMPITPNHAVWGALLGACVIHENRHSWLLPCTAFSVADGVQTEDAAAAIAKLVLESNPQTLSEALSRPTIQWTPELVDKVMKRLWNHGPKALQFFKHLVHNPSYTHSTSAFDHAIDIAARMRDYSSARALLARMRGPTRRTFAILAERYVSAGKPLRAVNLFLSMHHHGCCQDLHSFNTILDILCKSKRVEMAHHLFKTLRHKFCANSITYNTIANGYCIVKRTPMALKVLKEMVERGISPTAVTYNTMLKGYFKNRQLKEAWEFYLEMKKRKCEIDVVTYTTVIHGFGVAGEVKKARRVFDEMVKEGVAPSVVTYNALIQVLCKKESVESAWVVFEEMVGEGLCVPNVTTYNVVIRGLCHAGDMERALGFVGRMEEHGLRASVQTYNVLIRYFCDAGEIERGLEVFEKMGVVSACPIWILIMF